KTSVLRDAALGAAQVAAAVEKLPDAPACDGMEIDSKNNLYLTGFENGEILRRTPDGKTETVVKEERLQWPDTFAWDPDGKSIYFTDSQLDKSPNWNKGVGQPHFIASYFNFVLLQAPFQIPTMDSYSYIANADAAAIETLYQAYRQNPESVDFGWRKFFEGFDFSQQFPEGAPVVPGASGATNGSASKAAAAPAPGPVPQPNDYGVLNTAASTNNAPGLAQGDVASDKETAVRNLIHAFRSRGHLRAKTNPVRERKDRQARLNLSDFGLSEADLDTKFRQGEDLGLGQSATLREIVAALTSIYAGTVGFEYTYIRD
nr:hypothetical protein [Tanacetum cinerariifolium]